MIRWTGPNKGKLRKALLEFYTSERSLKRFVSDNFECSLTDIGGDSLEDWAEELIDKAVAEGWIKDLYEKLCLGRQNHEQIIQMQLALGEPALTSASLQQRSLVQQLPKLSEADWELLFEQFSLDDFSDLQRAFIRGIQQTFKLSFQEMHLGESLPMNPRQIRELLARRDRPDQAVRFVDLAITELRRSSEGKRDLAGLEQWRDRIAQQFNVLAQVPEPGNTNTCHAFLLVTLEECGSDVTVYPELRITRSANPIPFGAKPYTGSVEQVTDCLSEWIDQAEAVLDDRCEDAEVTLEVFLPCRYLEEDIAATWTVKNRRGDAISLGVHRRFVVRSSDRIRDRQIQKTLERNWRRLEKLVEQQNINGSIYHPANCPSEKGVLAALLKDHDAIGLKLLTHLPIDPNQRQGLLYDLIDSAVPIALWLADAADIDTYDFDADFNHLLQGSHLINFAQLAKQWRSRRMNSEGAKQIKLLCDRPDRIPKLPDPDQEEDLLVA
jgi:hypothetical protein